MQSQISVLNFDLVGLYERRKRGNLTHEQNVELKEKKKKSDKKEHRNQEIKRKEALFEDNAELRTRLNIRAKHGSFVFNEQK